MALELPKWLNEKFLAKCLQDGKENNEILVTRFEATSVVPPGNNYASCLLRVKMDYEKKGANGIQHLSLIVKGPLEEGTGNAMFDQFFATEPLFYKTFLPMSLNKTFAPKSYFSDVNKVIVLEDLNSEGFILADRLKQLDYDHCYHYATASATFHAVSVDIHRKQPELVERLGNEKQFLSDSESASGFKKFTLNGLCFMANKMKRIDKFKKYSNLMINYSADIWDLVMKARKPKATLSVLNQGDPWCPNMMFKYDESGKVLEIKLLDFQALGFSSPANDLVFFVWTSSNHYVRENKLTDFYHAYCDTLNKKLQEFSCDVSLSYEQLLEDIRLLSPYALMLIASSYPIMISQKSADISSLMSPDCDDSRYTSTFNEFYDKDYCENQLPRVLNQLDSSGVFDYLETCLKK